MSEAILQPTNDRVLETIKTKGRPRLNPESGAKLRKLEYDRLYRQQNAARNNETNKKHQTKLQESYKLIKLIHDDDQLIHLIFTLKPQLIPKINNLCAQTYHDYTDEAPEPQETPRVGQFF